MLGKKLFGNGIKYPLYRFGGAPERFLRKKLYLDSSHYKRTPKLMQSNVGDIVPAFETTKCLSMVDASVLSSSTKQNILSAEV